MTVPKRPRGWTGCLLAEGEDPDPRFTLANERTFLAWIRTALAIIALGLGLALVGARVEPAFLRDVLVAGLAGAGALLAALAFHRWLHTERALRRSESIPPPALAPIISYGLAAIALVVLIGFLVRR